MLRALLTLMTFALLGAGCGAGNHGYARTYVELADEGTHLQTATALPYDHLDRPAGRELDQRISWFGVVETVTADPKSGKARVLLSYRRHVARHLCYDERASSCRVTVSERSPGTFVALLTLRPEEKTGRDRVWAGSLLRVYATPSATPPGEDGPELTVHYHRHWPRGTFVTTAQAAGMRR